MGNLYSLFGESSDPSVKPFPNQTMTCEQFDVYAQKKVLIMPNMAFFLYDEPKFKESIDKVVLKDRSTTNWFMLGTMGDVGTTPFTNKKIVKALNTMVLLGRQDSIRPATISKIREEICGKPYPKLTK